MLEYSLVIVGVALLGSALPLFARRSDRLLHLFISFATGLFLGVVFLHMLPGVAEMAAGRPAEWGVTHGAGLEASAESAAAEGSNHGGFLWVCVLIGVLGLYVIEYLLLDGAGGSDLHRHTTLGYAAFVGLCIHALTAGMGLAAAGTDPQLGFAVYLSIVLHKASEGFSLATVFLLAGMRKPMIVVVVGAFSLVTPAGLLLGTGLLNYLPNVGVEALMALAAGTFLFVALCDLLPEVFHHREDVLAKIVLLSAGVALSAVVHEIG